MNPRSLIATLPGAVRWSILVQPFEHPSPLIEMDADQVCATASIGKVLLLISVAEQVESGALGPESRVSRSAVDPVGDSGLWQHLDVENLSISDACRLVGATSDNLATNALLSCVGLDLVSKAGRRLGMRDTALHDIVRDHRLPQHPACLSSGSARELVRLCRVLQEADGVSPGVAAAVTGWLSTNTDLSMVGSAWGLDPLAHARIDRGTRLWNKTGTNDGVRCDIGVVSHGSKKIAYAVLANWDPADSDDSTRDDVLASMNKLGALIRASLSGTPAR